MEANTALAHHLDVPRERMIGAPVTDYLASGQAARLDAYRDDEGASHDLVRIHFADSTGAPLTLNCLVRQREGGLLIVGEPEHVDDRLAVSEMLRLNNELSTMARESARRERELDRTRQELEKTLEELRTTYWHLKRVQEVLPICMGCGKVKSDEASWETVADYLKANEIFLSHGYCPTCAARVMEEIEREGDT